MSYTPDPHGERKTFTMDDVPDALHDLWAEVLGRERRHPLDPRDSVTTHARHRLPTDDGGPTTHDHDRRSTRHY